MMFSHYIIKLNSIFICWYVPESIDIIIPKNYIYGFFSDINISSKAWISTIKVEIIVSYIELSVLVTEVLCSKLLTLFNTYLDKL